MEGRIIVTGASGSMGAAAVEALVAGGHPVVMACRNLAKASDVRDGVFSRHPSAEIDIRQLDLSSMESVRRFAASVKSGSVAALFNNAGVMDRRFRLTRDGLENTMSVNYFGPWLLTNLLLDKLPADARIVNMVSLTCRFAHIDVHSIFPTEKGYGQLRNYSRSKRALLSFSQELARRHPLLRVNVADPGIVASNMIDLGRWFDPLADALFKPFCKKPAQGVAPALAAIRSDVGMQCFKGSGSGAIAGRFIDPALDSGLWEATAKFFEEGK